MLVAAVPLPSSGRGEKRYIVPGNAASGFQAAFLKKRCAIFTRATVFPSEDIE